MLKTNRNHGMALLVVIVLIGFMLVIAAAFASHFHRARLQHFRGRRSAYALSYAEAGLNKAVWELSRRNDSYKGESNTPFGNGLFSVTVNDIEGERELKVIRATGKAYSIEVPAKGEKKLIMTIEATVRITNAAVEGDGTRRATILDWKEVE